MNDELKFAIDTVNKLFDQRDGAEWWADNIIEASKHLTRMTDWTKFYAYLANPDQFDPNEELTPIGDDPMEIDAYPSHMKEIRYQNGTETIIHVKNLRFDDEKTES